jgi:hypothetical protein
MPAQLWVVEIFPQSPSKPAMQDSLVARARIAVASCGCHNRGTYLLRGRLWAWGCPDCGVEGVATEDNNNPGAAPSTFARVEEQRVVQATLSSPPKTAVF